jgi:hypothetical protein
LFSSTVVVGVLLPTAAVSSSSSSSFCLVLATVVVFDAGLVFCVEVLRGLAALGLATASEVVSSFNPLELLAVAVATAAAVGPLFFLLDVVGAGDLDLDELEDAVGVFDFEGIGLFDLEGVVVGADALSLVWFEAALVAGTELVALAASFATTGVEEEEDSGALTLEELGVLVIGLFTVGLELEVLDGIFSFKLPALVGIGLLVRALETEGTVFSFKLPALVGIGLLVRALETEGAVFSFKLPALVGIGLLARALETEGTVFSFKLPALVGIGLLARALETEGAVFSFKLPALVGIGLLARALETEGAVFSFKLPDFGVTDTGLDFSLMLDVGVGPDLEFGLGTSVTDFFSVMLPDLDFVANTGLFVDITSLSDFLLLLTESSSLGPSSSSSFSSVKTGCR